MTYRIFIWRDVLFNYNFGSMWACAESVEQARKLLLAKCPYLPPEDLAETPEEYPIGPIAEYHWGNT